MKKIIKIVLTSLFISLLVFSIYSLIFNFSNERLAFAIFAFVFFVMHLFAWIAPKKFFDLCWKITGILPDNFDYNASFSKLELCDIGILAVANILVTIGIII
jgi:DMSO/TMAO reductase YedYZ heme-binding membrane subunit